MKEIQFIIEAKLTAETDFLCKCIILIWTQQEEDEQDVRTTAYNNGVGFNKSDAPFLSRCAEYIQQYHSLNQHDLQEAKRRMKKYAGQLSELLGEEDL